MKLNMKWTCIVFLLLLLPITAYSQTGLYKLRQGGMAAGLSFTGLDFSSSQDAIGIGGSFSYGISNHTKIELISNIGFLDRNRYGSEFDVPPSLAVGIRSVHTRPLGQTGLDYFLTGAFYRGFSSGISRPLDAPADATLLSVRTNGLSGGGGIAKRLETNFGWVLNPFCGLSYSRSWTRVSRTEAPEMILNRARSGYGGQVGLEIELSPAISVRGAFGVSFENFDGSFSIGLNFH
ncbi:MAG: hypothetical protein OXL96_27910 [Candidatus Poribacteria bacterium]|nr:hypothetical protein [Candidatus Poribacteria bacterium]